MNIFEPDPLDEELLIESLGGTSPTPHPPAPTPAILALLTKRAMQQQQQEQALSLNPTPRPKPLAAPATGPAPAPDAAPPQSPPPSIEPAPPPPAQPSLMEGAMRLMSVPSAALAGFTRGAHRPQGNAPQGLGERLQQGVTQGGQAALDAFTGKPPATMSGVFKESGIDLGGAGGTALDIAADPTNWWDLGATAAAAGGVKAAGMGGAALLPRLLKQLPEGVTAKTATDTAGLAYEGVKALKALDKPTADKFMAATANHPRVRKAAQSLHPAEVARLTTEDAVRQFDRFYDVLPDTKTLIGGIHGGAIKRGWYEHSRNAIEHVYGKDADLFAGVLAATSPQNSVESNFQNATNVFDDWLKAGRPSDAKQIEALMRDTIRRTTKEGEGKVLPAWINNTVRVLQEGPTLSGPKVDSFWTNLRSRVRQTSHGTMNPDQATTLDAWMANLFGVHNEAFAGSATKAQIAQGNPGFTPQYLAGSARVRESAKAAGIAPAEAQETLWSFGKALYEQAEEEGKTARQIIESGTLSPDRVLGTPDFSVLFQQKGVKVPSETVARWQPDANMKKEMLKLADTLDALWDRRQMATSYKTARPDKKSVMANMMLEARPGAGAASMGSDFPTALAPKKLAEVLAKGKKTPEQALQDAQNYWSNQRLSALENEKGQNVVMAELFPDNTPPVAGGVGHWRDPATNTLEANKVQAIPLRLRTNKAGTAIHPDDAMKARIGRDLNSLLLRQKAGVITAMQPGESGNVMRLWPSVKSESMPPAALNQLGEMLPADQYALQHSTEGLNVVDFTGQPIAPEKAQSIDALARQLIHGQAPRSPKTTPQKVMGSKLGTNIADEATAYAEYPWAEKPSGQLTKAFVGGDYAQLDNATKRRLDGRKMRDAAADQLRLLERNPDAPIDQVNFLRAISTDGVSGLAKALGDPSKVLPMLAALGLGSALGLGAEQEQ